MWRFDANNRNLSEDKWAAVTYLEESEVNPLSGENERDAFDEALSEISTDRIEQEPGELSLLKPVNP